MKLRLVVTLLLGAALLHGAGNARAAEPPRLAIPRVETVGVEEQLGELLTRLLREEVERLGRYKSIGTPRLGLRDMMSAVDCANDSPACLAAVGRELKVHKLVLGKLDRAGERFLVTLQLFDVPNERIDLRLQRGVVGRDALVAEFPRMVRRFLGLKEGEAGTLEITATEPGVQVRIDGMEQGTAPLRLERIAVGEYRVEARKEGYPPFTTVVRVEQDKTAQVAVVLGAAATAPTPAPGPKPGLKDVRWYTWTLLGAGVGGLVAGGALGGIVQRRQAEFDDDIRAGGIRTGEDLTRFEQRAESGSRLALGANVAFAIGGAALATGTLLLSRDLGLLGSRPAPPSEKPEHAKATRGVRTRIVPLASFGPAGGLAGIRIER